MWLVRVFTGSGETAADGGGGCGCVLGVNVGRNNYSTGKNYEILN